MIPAPLFTNNAVLQRDKPIPIWGTAAPHERVSVTFSGQVVETIADASGRWIVTLSPLPACSIGSELVIKGRKTVTLENIVVGEVWIASGQSNMEWSVADTYDKSIDVAASGRESLIRHISIRKTVAEIPLTDVAVDRSSWEVAGPNTTANFTAVGYYFAKDIHALTRVPIGIVGCSWGGTPIESWIDHEAYQTVPTEAALVMARWEKLMAEFSAAQCNRSADVEAWQHRQPGEQGASESSANQAPCSLIGSGHQNTPSGLYNAMVNPLVPYAIRGAIWYQGESNVGRADEYQALFSAMITGWRAKFGQDDFPFYWVQLANFAFNGSTEGTSWAFLREAQTRTLALPNTGQAVILDIGDCRDIHPRNKKEVGRRLARLALKHDYGFDQMIVEGPLMTKAERDGPGFTVSFANSAEGLIAPLNELSGFELAGEDREFRSAEAKIRCNNVFVFCAEVPEPVAVRFCWRNAPVVGLFNLEGLPASPFRSDSFPAEILPGDNW